MFYYKETCRVERGFHLVTPSFFPECIILYYLLSCPHSRCLESTTFHSHLIQQSCMKHAGCPGGNRWAKVPGRKCPDKSTNRCKLEYEWYRQGAMRGRRGLGTSGCRVRTRRVAEKLAFGGQVELWQADMVVTPVLQREQQKQERETGKSWECAMSHKTPNSQGRSHYSQSSGEKLRLLEVIWFAGRESPSSLLLCASSCSPDLGILPLSILHAKTLTLFRMSLTGSFSPVPWFAYPRPVNW